MGKHEPMTAKAIANKIKAKGLQKIKYYCEMCKKQCRDDNGFKCHIMSESHQRQALIVSENPDKFVNEFSKEFTEGFMYILKTRYRTKRILANTVFQEYIKERQHTHLNSTRWTSLTEFANWLGENGIVKVDNSERGVMVTYIDKDPETIRRQELEAKRAQQAKEAAERDQKEIDQQREATKKLLAELESKREQLPIEPIPIIKVKNDSEARHEDAADQRDPKIELPSGHGAPNLVNEESERPVFKIEAISLKASTPSGYKPPPPKRKVSKKPVVDKRMRLK